MTDSVQAPCVDEHSDVDSVNALIENLKQMKCSNLKEYCLDFRGLDILQQAIVAGNHIAVSVILLRDIFPEGYDPPCNNYLHLACRLGLTQIAKSICVKRPADIHKKCPVCFPNRCFHGTSKNTCIGPLQNQLRIGLYPLELTVKYKHTDCLVGMLGCASTSPDIKYGSATLLAEYDLAEGLLMLIKSGSYFASDLHTCFLHALRKKRHQCLDVLFSNGFKDVKIRGMNPYHMLYQYSSGYNRHRDRHEGLALTTQCMIRHGLKPSEAEPTGTYPLYSLLDLITKDLDVYSDEYLSDSVSRELITSLKILLKQGSCVDLDELMIGRTDDLAAFGRERAASAFHLLSQNLEKFTSVSVAIGEILKQCYTLLLSYKSKSYQLKASTMTGLLQLLGRSRMSETSCKPIVEILISIIKDGANVAEPVQHVYGLGGSYHYNYPLNIYVEALCKVNFTMSRRQTLNDLPILRYLINLMPYDRLCAALNINTDFLCKTTRESFTPNTVQLLTRPQMRSLSSLSALQIWISVSCNKERISQLELPKYLKSDFMRLVIS